MTQELISNAENAEDKNTVWQYLRPHLWVKNRPDLKARVVISLILLVLAKIVVVALPFFYKEAVDLLENKSSREVALLSLPFWMILAYGVSRAVGNAFQQLRDTVFTKVGQRALRLLALQTFKHIHNLSLRFHLARRTGGLSRVIDRGTKGVDFLLRMFLFNLLPTALEIILTGGVMFYTLGFFYGVITTIMVIAYVIFTYFVNEWRTGFRREMNDKDNEAAQKAVDSLLNYETVKYFGNEENEAERFDKAMRGYESAWIKIYESLGWLNFGQSFIIAFGMTAAMWFAANEVLGGQKTLGDFVLVNTLMIQIYQPLNFLGTVFREIKQSYIDMENMLVLLKEDKEITDSHNAKPLVGLKGDIRFENVSFHYDPGREILSDVSFSVPAGKTVAIVGGSGAGKSTITRLLFRFYDPIKGNICIDGQNICDLTQVSLRAGIGIVPQDTVLFNDTLEYNIRYGKLNATFDEVREAARAARLHHFIEKLPDGYQTQVGERGLKLSGGEKQRVAVARALLKNPPILIFDEATSALDTATEREIQKELDEIAQGRTALMIAHRLSTVVNADEIIVMGAGQIIEKGSHSELIEKEGEYYKMWQAQLKEKAPDSEKN